MIQFQEMVEDGKPGELQSLGPQRGRTLGLHNKMNKQDHVVVHSAPKSCLTLGLH